MMGGRGSASILKRNPYANMSMSALTDRLNRAYYEINQARPYAAMTDNGTSKAVRRKKNSAIRKINRLNKEVADMEEAYDYLRRHPRRNVPFS